MPILNNKTLAMLHMMPGELRNTVYEAYFPSLPASKTPLARAHEYRPSTGLCLADRGLASETLGYLKPIAAAWKETTWTVDLDHFFPAAVPDAGEHDTLGAILPEDVTARLTDADAKCIRTIEFSTSAFVLPAREGANVLAKLFLFSVRLLSTGRMVIETPLLEEEWQSFSGLQVNVRVVGLLTRLHVSLCTKRWCDQRSGRTTSDRRAWTAVEIRKVLCELSCIISGLKAEGVKKEAEVVAWAEAWRCWMGGACGMDGFRGRGRCG